MVDLIKINCVFLHFSFHHLFFFSRYTWCDHVVHFRFVFSSYGVFTALFSVWFECSLGISYFLFVLVLYDIIGVNVQFSVSLFMWMFNGKHMLFHCSQLSLICFILSVHLLSQIFTWLVVFFWCIQCVNKFSISFF